MTTDVQRRSPWIPLIQVSETHAQQISPPCYRHRFFPEGGFPSIDVLEDLVSRETHRVPSLRCTSASSREYAYQPTVHGRTMNPGAKDHSLQFQSFVRTDDCPKRYLQLNSAVPDSNNVVHLSKSTNLGRLGSLRLSQKPALPISFTRKTLGRPHACFT